MKPFDVESEVEVFCAARGINEKYRHTLTALLHRAIDAMELEDIKAVCRHCDEGARLEQADHGWFYHHVIFCGEERSWHCSASAIHERRRKRTTHPPQDDPPPVPWVKGGTV